MKLEDIMEGAREGIGAKRVFGEPYEKNGVTVITAARVMGGMGAGDSDIPARTGSKDSGAAGMSTKQTGSGAGFGMMGGPAGAFVIKGDDVRWLPAVDVNRLMFGFQVVMIVFFLAVRSVMKARAKV